MKENFARFGLFSFFLGFLLFATEFLGLLFYWGKNGYSLPPHFGGPALYSVELDDVFEFDPITVFANRNLPRNIDLYNLRKWEIPKTPGELRVFIVGGSTVANHRIAPGQRLNDYLEKFLRGQKIPAKVFNLGTANYTSFNEMNLILGKLIHHKPDLVILFNGVNDAFYGALTKPEWFEPNVPDFSLRYRERVYLASLTTPSEKFYQFLDAYSYSRYWLKRKPLESPVSEAEAREQIERDTELRTQQDPIAFGRDFTPFKTMRKVAVVNERADRAFLNNITILAASLSHLGIPFLHVLQPTALTKKKLFPREKWSIDFNNAAYANFEAVTKKTFENYRAGLQKVSGKFPKIRFLDLSHFTDDKEEYLYDDYCHAYAKGRWAQWVGEAIGRALLSYPLLPVK